MPPPPVGSLRGIPPDQPLPIDQELRVALGLLLKHRGGPGFGHGRLEGEELDSMSKRLRGIAGRLLDEARNAASD